MRFGVAKKQRTNIYIFWGVGLLPFFLSFFLLGYILSDLCLPAFRGLNSLIALHWEEPLSYVAYTTRVVKLTSD